MKKLVLILFLLSLEGGLLTLGASSQLKSSPGSRIYKATQQVSDCLCSYSKPCVISTNVIDRFSKDTPWTVEFDQRPTEFGWHTPIGGLHPIKFVTVPSGKRVRIVGYDLDTVARWTLRDSTPGLRSAWGLTALHTFAGGNYDVTVPPSGRDVLKWAQMAVSDERHKIVSPWREDAVVNGILTNDNTLWIKHAMFNNLGGHEMQIETTGEFFFCYE